MPYLVAALAAPGLGPVLYRVLHERPRAVRLVDGFGYVSVPLLAVWQVAPGVWAEQSFLAPLAVVGGFLLPSLFERASNALEEHTDNLAIMVGLSGLALHALMEGVAFAAGAGAVNVPFALAVILHRIPVGLVIWWLLRPRHGVYAAGAGVGIIILATAVGYGAGTGFSLGGQGSGVEIYQAFVSGSLVLVVFHQGRHDHQHGDQHHGA